MVKRFYEIMYRYFWTPWNTGVRGELVSLVESGCIKPERAIDLGCRTGANAIYLAQKGEVTGVDYAEAAIEKARARTKEAGTQVNFIVDDLRNLRQVSGSVGHDQPKEGKLLGRSETDLERKKSHEKQAFMDFAWRDCPH